MFSTGLPMAAWTILTCTENYPLQPKNLPATGWVGNKPMHKALSLHHLTGHMGGIGSGITKPKHDEISY